MVGKRSGSRMGQEWSLRRAQPGLAANEVPPTGGRARMPLRRCQVRLATLLRRVLAHHIPQRCVHVSSTHGGATDFSTARLPRMTVTSVQPEAGCALLLAYDVPHSESPLVAHAPSPKYILRTEVLYSSVWQAWWMNWAALGSKMVSTGLLREEAGGLWTSLAAERKRFRQNVV